ncbi:hypothetical protein ACUIJN_23705, partial [Metabacillus halosaccharovorans]|uniref:hypothetical protein n=1 Tax=Metabacillus halosaccharovorans TaxID=930124 RepID=UPI00403DAB0A
KQEKLIEEMNKTITEKDDYIINLESTVRKLIEHGLSKDAILEITGITLERYRILLLKENIITSHIYLTKDEAEEYEQLLREIYHSNNMDELINLLKELKRINFIHKVLLRYKREYDCLTKE